jgi:MOSC domain-containing protein YiiM
LSEAYLLEGRGIAGDLASARSDGKRQVSLLQAEHLPVIAALLAVTTIDPTLLRRNLIVRGINLHALRATRFQIGEVVLEGSGTCEPCSKMERALGVGGYNALRGHGGILARVVRAGVIRLKDEVDFCHEP